MAPTLTAGTVCQCQAISADLRIGDVVAVDWSGKRRVKRVAALPGDVVELDRGRLLVNQQRLEDLLADRDFRGTIAPARVPVAASDQDWNELSVRHLNYPGRCWVLEYRNRHAGGRVTPIMDDYPGNHSVRRILNPVDRLAVSVGFSNQLHELGLQDMDAGGTDWSAPSYAFFYRPGSSVWLTQLKRGHATSRDAKQPSLLGCRS